MLFYSHSGNFEDGSLVLTCEDFLPMDLGSTGWTEFKMNEDVAGYIADNIDLFECEIGILHSHHALGAFLSGQDIKRINEDGNDTNCFLSLVVDTKGEYVAAITRKIQSKTEVTTKSLGTSYQFFGEGAVTTEGGSAPAVTQIVDKEYIEYYMLDVERETVDNPLEYLDNRFNEIEKKKAEERKSQFISSYSTGSYNWSNYENDNSFESWLKNKRPEPVVKEQFLFDDKTMKEMESIPKINIPLEEVHKCVVKMLTCSLLINVNEFNMDSWIRNHMKTKYDTLFAAPQTFDQWSEFIVDFLVTNYYDDSLPEEAYYDYDSIQSELAVAMYEELDTYKGVNSYIDEYLKVINRYIL